ncbi:MAG TPA: response regulator transcription factor [Thermomicrobiales bacterium]|jgi:DNA-binding response OmpR family regulator
MSGQRDGGPIQVLLVEDEETVSEFIAMGLGYEGFEVETVHDGRDALATFERVQPDIVLLDLMLPGIDGMTLCRTFRARSDVPIIMLTARDAVEDRVQGLNAGADDYLPKPFKFTELIARMNAVLRRHQVTANNVLATGSLTLDRGTREVYDGGRSLTLTPREFDLLEYFMLNPRQVLTREAILGRVWGYDSTVETNVVDVYVRYLRGKLTDDRHERIQSVRGVGYLLRP